MEPQSHTFNNQATQQNMVKPNKCKHVPIIIVLAVLFVCSCAFGGFELYQNTKSNEQNHNTECEQGDNENVAEDDTSFKSMTTGNASFTVPNSPYDDGTVKFEYGVYNNVLSTYSISSRSLVTEISSEVISSNIDLKTNKKLDNATTLNRFGSTIDEAYQKILNNLVETVSIDSFLLDEDGDVSAEKITVNDFKKNIDKYIETLKNDQNLFYVFLKDSKVTVSYEQYKVLKKLGMSSHMGAGLVDGYAEVEL